MSGPKSSAVARVRRGSGGFTLLEMMVVLILTAMVTGLLLQGLHQVFRLQTRFGSEMFNTQQGAMMTEWFRQSVNGLVPDHADGKNRFRGGGREFSGMTLSPLDVASDALLPFTWRIKFDPESGQTRLYYGSATGAPPILSWPGNAGKFVYFDAGGGVHETWPPAFGKWPQLPRMIHLEIVAQGGGAVIVAVPKGLESPLPRQKDIQD